MTSWEGASNNNNYYNNDDTAFGQMDDGTITAKELQWDIFDRSHIGKDPHDRNDSTVVGAHPTNEILEIELEFLIILIRNLRR